MFSRNPLITLCFFVLPLIPIPLSAQGAYEAEFQKIRQDREQSLEAAAAPINRRYKESLEQLLRRATQNADLDTALRIREALAALEHSSSATNPVGKWAWGADRTITIQSDGRFTVNRGDGGKWNWTNAEKREFTMIWDSGGFVDKLVISADGKNITGSNNKGNKVNVVRLK
ncbi:MAG: hypothetical protein EOP87_05720 [Verrucomicrobiaceae bacterium]|nr:MAG: hypothetical protein EOP87_05720 [Verrucomicrobiaceae bacterium]